MGKKGDTLSEEIKRCMVVLSAKSTEMHRMLKVKNAQHLSKQSFIGGYRKIHLYYILMSSNQQALGSKKGKQLGISRSRLSYDLL